MKLPRDITGRDLARALGRIGYRIARQTGSHLRLVHEGPPQHSITIPAHDPLKTGTLAAILKQVGDQLKMTRNELLSRLDI